MIIFVFTMELRINPEPLANYDTTRIPHHYTKLSGLDGMIIE
jgi:hypothetical protein